MKIRSIPALAAGLSLFAVGLAQAQIATGEMSVSAEVTRTCTLSAEALAFGPLSVLEVNTGSAVVTLVCNGTSTVTSILVGMGANADPPTTQRNLASGTDLVPYTLHLVEGDNTDIATDGAAVLVREGTTNTYSVTLHGEIQHSTAYQMGTYTDTVVLTAAYSGP
jgi:spore coat protein U-like protein